LRPGGSVAPGATGEAYRTLITQEALALWTVSPEVAERMLAALQTAELVARLAELGLLALREAPGGRD
jgi:hypothetical protein